MPELVVILAIIVCTRHWLSVAAYMQLRHGGTSAHSFRKFDTFCLVFAVGFKVRRHNQCRDELNNAPRCSMSSAVIGRVREFARPLD